MYTLYVCICEKSCWVIRIGFLWGRMNLFAEAAEQENNILSSCELFESCLDYWGTLLEYYWISYIILAESISSP